MNVSKFEIADSELEEIITYLIANLSFNYENHSSDMTILTSEDFYFRNSSTQLNMIIAKKVDSSILIDVIGGAGGSGLFNINWGSEKGYIKKVKKVLKKYVEINNLSLDQVA